MLDYMLFFRVKQRNQNSFKEKAREGKGLTRCFGVLMGRLRRVVEGRPTKARKVKC